MAGLAKPGYNPYQTPSTTNTYGYVGGSQYAPGGVGAGGFQNPIAGDTSALPTGDVMQQRYQPNLSGGTWTYQNIGKTLPAQQFEFDKQRWGQVLDMMRGVTGQLSQGGGSSLGDAIAPPRMPGRTPAPTWTPDEGVSAAAFARNKDNVGRLMSSAQRDIKDVMGARGIGGSGLENKLLAQNVNEGLRSLALGELNRAVANEGRQFEMTKLGASLGSAERAQDINALSNWYATQVAQRGQQANDPRIQMLMGLASTIGGLY
jgi:hypothetical protein